MEIGVGADGDELFIARECIRVGRGITFSRDARGRVRVRLKGKAPSEFGSVKIQSDVAMDDGLKIIGEVPYLDAMVSDWQFIYLDPKGMGEPTRQYRTSTSVDLNHDGSNIAEYLLYIRKLDQSVFDGIVEVLRYVLPYARDLQPKTIAALDRQVYLQMKEGKFDVPGWLLSTGT